MNNNTLSRNSHQYYGAIHIHTKYSDGTGDVNTISNAAKKAGLDWIIITDHNSLEAEEGIYNGIYVIKGEEISPQNGNHYLALGISNPISPNDDAQTNINNVRNQGGFGFAAHPDERESRKNKHKPLPWYNRNIKPDGVEIWNWFSNWGDNLNDKNIFKLAYSYFFKNKIITSPKNELNWWDKLNKTDRDIVPAIGGVDAHALKIYRYVLPLTVFPYKTCFKTITNVITLDSALSQDFETAKAQILNAIKQGKNLIINRKIYNSVPEVTISNSKSVATCGEAISLMPNTYLNIQSRNEIEAKVIIDGIKEHQLITKSCKIKLTKAGKYRVEFLHSGRSFAYTNPIQVLQGEN